MKLSHQFYFHIVICNTKQNCSEYFLQKTLYTNFGKNLKTMWSQKLPKKKNGGKILQFTVYGLLHLNQRFVFHYWLIPSGYCQITYQTNRKQNCWKMICIDKCGTSKAWVSNKKSQIENFLKSFASSLQFQMIW